MDRKKWRLVVNVHVADDDEEALRHVKKAERHETVTYFEETLGRPPGRMDDPLTEGVKMAPRSWARSTRSCAVSRICSG